MSDAEHPEDKAPAEIPEDTAPDTETSHPDASQSSPKTSITQSFSARMAAKKAAAEKAAADKTAQAPTEDHPATESALDETIPLEVEPSDISDSDKTTGGLVGMAKKRLRPGDKSSKGGKKRSGPPTAAEIAAEPIPAETPTFIPADTVTTHPATSAEPYGQVSNGHLGSMTTATVHVADPVPEKPAAPRKTKSPHQTRKARLRISRVDPWSVMKTSLLFGVAGWIILIVATWVIFTVLKTTGLYSAINDTIGQVFTSASSTGTAFDITKYVNTTRATAVAAFVGAVNVILVTALATIFAFLYNLAANVMGGVEVTLAED